ncbi:methyltransferase family protein [Inquilinus sp.]|jgi:protein-S-isoprenylcysteine O-methyltransferase Ste14|uniref:methyltransferase family protein n=1 Tax=Inquilinus sp. TaxID=1932117 RepID=UPI0037831784
MAFVITGLWGAWFVYWHVAAFGTRPARRRESVASRLSHILLLAAVGTVVAIDRWSAVPALAVIATVFLRKIVIEERFMAEAFGPAYAAYSRSTARLVPYLW